MLNVLDSEQVFSSSHHFSETPTEGVCVFVNVDDIAPPQHKDTTLAQTLITVVNTQHG